MHRPQRQKPACQGYILTHANLGVQVRNCAYAHSGNTCVASVSLHLVERFPSLGGAYGSCRKAVSSRTVCGYKVGG